MRPTTTWVAAAAWVGAVVARMRTPYLPSGTPVPCKATVRGVKSGGIGKQTARSPVLHVATPVGGPTQYPAMVVQPVGALYARSRVTAVVGVLSPAVPML